MNPILSSEVIKCIEEVDKAIDEMRETIRHFREKSLQMREKGSRSIQESVAQLKEIEQRLTLESLQEIRQDLERAREKAKQLSLNPLLNPSQVERMRMSIEQSLKLLQEAGDTIQGFQAEVLGIQKVAETLEAHSQKMESSLQKALGWVDDLLDGMRRDLTHLEESSDPEATVRSVTNLLRRSLQLAALLFRPEELQKLAETHPWHLAQLRQGWGKWLQELGSYIQEAYRQSSQMAGLEQSLENFRRACEKVANMRLLDFPPGGPSAPYSGEKLI